ncbi:MAG TPA: endolytic transglycosylase MltG [Rhizomicrobium sp.]|nr:endolytic transglycosylase MltG [Rhizomicrobium sp.]
MRTFIFLLVLAAIGFGAYEWDVMNYTAPGPAPRDTVVLIKPGEGVSAISQKLFAAGTVINAQLFALDLRVRGQSGALKAGEYAIPAHASESDIADILVSGKSIEHKLTAAEGLTSEMIYNIVKNDPALEGDAGPVPPEGTLLPETYLFTHGTTRAELLERMQRDQAKFVQEQWERRAPGLPLATPDQAVILASVVEKETAIPAERRHIAAVFINRLKLGMKLQSDPTIIYGITRGYPLGRRILQSEINRATPYNTYAIQGLPATPICNPGKDAIAAVLNPAQSNDLYFVADGTGGHVFSDNIAQHEKNVAKWRKIEEQRH